jgi:hypothetical protein
MKFTIGVFLAFSLFSCGSKKSDDPVATASTHATIMAAKCATSGCHANGANKSICGVDFTTSETTYKAAEACATTTSRPSARIALTSGSLMMPPSGSAALTADEKAVLAAIK